MLKAFILVATGGALGSVLRFALGQWQALKTADGFPWATLCANLAGCLLIGIAVGLMAKHDTLTTDFHRFAVIGFCGGFTTFSTFSNETLRMISQGNLAQAAIYVSISVLVGLALTFMGYKITFV
jgi:CrcB protein